MAWEDDDGGSDKVRVTHRSMSFGRAGLGPVLGALLVAIGLAELLHQIVGRGVSVIPATIGILLLIRARSDGGHYPMTVIGAVLTGSGLGHFVGDVLGGGMSDALGSLGTAAGFYWLATSDRPRSGWAIVPAVILALIGVGQLGFHVSHATTTHAGWLLPAGVVVAGFLLVGSHRLPGPIRLAGLVFVVAAALSLLSGNRGNNVAHERVLKPPGAPLAPKPPSAAGAKSTPVALTDIGSREVWFEADTADVTVLSGDTPEVVGGPVHIERTDGRVTITGDGSGRYRLVVPPSTHLHITSDTGTVAVTDVPHVALDITTDTGAVNLLLQGDPTIQADTDSGSTSLSGFDGDDRTGGHAVTHIGTDDGTKVKVHTDTGDITIVHAA